MERKVKLATVFRERKHVLCCLQETPRKNEKHAWLNWGLYTREWQFQGIWSVRPCKSNMLVQAINEGTIPFGLTRDLIVFAISSAMLSYITSKSLIQKIWIWIFPVTHFPHTTKFLLQIQTFFSYIICLFYLSFVQSSNQICLIRQPYFSFCIFASDL